MDPSLAICRVDWAKLYAEAERQSVVGLCWGGIEKLPKDRMPDMDWLMEWLGQAEYLKTQKEQFDEVMSEFAELMDRNRIPYVVFKGLAVASNYPQPKLRTMGDIDFYVPQSDFERAVGVMEHELKVEIEKDDVDKHYSFDWKDIRFEMHYQMETFGRKRHQEYFGALIDEYLKLGALETFEAKGGRRVPMLSPVLDLLLVMKHWFTHLIGEGVGLRQTTDLAVLVMRYREVIDVKVLREHLQRIGYLKAMNAVVALVEKYYGIEWPEYKAYLRPGCYRNADRLMADVMRNGNFGRSDYKYKEGMKKRMETTMRFFTHSFRYFNLAPSDILCLMPKRIAISLKAHSK